MIIAKIDAVVNAIHPPHSFKLKALLAPFAPVIATLPVSNFYPVKTVSRPIILRDDEASTTTTSYGNYYTYAGFFYVALTEDDARSLAMMASAQLNNIEVRKVKLIYKLPEEWRTGVHNQTLLVNEPQPVTAYFKREHCSSQGTVRVCHITSEGWKCACQPHTWRDPAPRTICVETAYGPVCNPPFPFPPPPQEKRTHHTFRKSMSPPHRRRRRVSRFPRW